MVKHINSLNNEYSYTIWTHTYIYIQTHTYTSQNN